MDNHSKVLLKQFHVRIAFSYVINDLVPFLYLFVHEQNIFIIFLKNPFHLCGEIKFLKCHVLTLVGCSQIFLAALSSQYRQRGEIPKKSKLLGLGPTGSSDG